MNLHDLAPRIYDATTVSASNLPVFFTTFANERTATPTRYIDGTWDDLCERLRDHDLRPGKSGAAFGPYRLKANTTRASQNVEEICAYVIDCDNGTALQAVKARLAGYEAFFYSTHSHTPDQPKFRAVVPLRRAVKPDEWAIFRLAADRKFADGANDAATKDAARLYYFPSCPADNITNAWTDCVHGKPIDPDALIESHLSIEGNDPQYTKCDAAPSQLAAFVEGTASELTAYLPCYQPYPFPEQQAQFESALHTAIPCPDGWQEWHTGIWALIFLVQAHDWPEDDARRMAWNWSALSTKFDQGIFSQQWLDGMRRTRQKLSTGQEVTTHLTILKKARQNAPIAMHGSGSSAGSSGLANKPLHEIREMLNDAGNADLLINACGDKVRYCTELKSWMIWQGDYWQFDKQGKILEIAKSVIRDLYRESAAVDIDVAKALSGHAGRSLQISRLEAMVQLARSSSGIPVSVNQLNADPYLLGVKNGVIDLKTGQFRPAAPSDLITHCADVEYVPNAACPVWTHTLYTIFDGDQDVIDFLQRCIGYSLTGDTSEQVFFFLHGSGSNGKSTVLNVVREIIGGYGLQTQPEVLMARKGVNPSGPTPELARLAGPRFVVANETEDGQRFAESLVKQLTGGDAITARVLHGEPFDFIPQFKLWLAGNHKPIIRGDDYGIWRRIILLPFARQFSCKEKDKKLPEKLRNEYPGILNWMIAGTAAWRQRGLAAPQSVKQEVDAYKSDMDLMQQWLDDCCACDPGSRTGAQAAYRSFVYWAEQSGYIPFTAMRFAQKMQMRGFQKKRTERGNEYIGVRTK